MNKGRNHLDKHLDFILVDILLLVFCFITACMSASKKLDVTLLTSSIILILADSVSIFLTEPYKNVLRQGSWARFSKTITSTFTAIMTCSVIFYFFDVYKGYFDRILLATFLAHVLLCYLASMQLKRIVNKQQENRSKVALCEANLVSSIDDKSFTSIFVLDKNLKGKKISGHLITNNAEELDTLIENEWVDDYYLYVRDAAKYNGLINKLNRAGAIVKIKLPEIEGIYTLEKDKLLTSTKLVSNRYLFVKRVFDICCGLIGLVVLIPLSLIVKIFNLSQGDKEKIFYTQTRVGQNAKEIKIYKYRSMVPNAEEILQTMLKDPVYKKEWDEKQKFDKDPRITKIGNFLRKTSLDELPQLLNVLKGDMSLVGPRPLVPEELASHKGQRFYYIMKPGITGWWGCNGRSDVSYEERLDLEYYYIRNCSVYLDLKIIWMTIVSIIKKKGAK